MTQRTTAGLVAVLLLGALVAWTVFKPLPYVTYEPGTTIDVLGKTDGKEIIQVSGHKVYRDAGQLRMTTVLVSTPNARLDLFTLMSDWFNPNDAIYPRSAVYAPEVDEEENTEQGQVEMVTSQDAAAAAALRELGYEVNPVIEVAAVQDGTPAAGKLKVRDVLLKVGGIPIETAEDVSKAVTDAAEGQAVEFVVRRGGKGGKVVRTSITPTTIDGAQRVGIRIGTGFQMPFNVSVNISDNIGGPSAGLMFSLAIYDTLTPGSLTGGNAVAGTGTIDEQGKVGPIGGIQQKIVGARDDGAQLFMVPPDNCEDALHSNNGSMRLVKAVTMHAAVQAIEKWVKNPDATLPACTDDTAQEATR
ncbi:PDZ domain-containing protein [Nocardioides agariphilus]|jgi:PDZ domain-containing protein|uniref:PDZ domain-containing protein n=1 Tax=Nocardioides agariphilus TaxID=433664 RepID=A0A930VKP0_9ACTN|nr:PDZ domain-containing protein [Nocardioides agariphilus]MBF4766312.1 PDZ domain-containing protein [Nocardioides agariphilus]